MLVRDRISTPSREVWRVLEQLVRTCARRRARRDRTRPSIVGVSCTTPFDLTAGSVSPHLIPAWTAFPLREYLEDLTGLPVVLDTAASALAAGERWVGDATARRQLPDARRRRHRRVGVHDRRRAAPRCAGQRRLARPRRSSSRAARRVGAVALGCLTAMVSATDLEREMNRPLRRATDTIIDRTGIMIGRAIATSMAIVDVSTVFITGSVVDTFGDPLLEADPPRGDAAVAPHAPRWILAGRAVRSRSSRSSARGARAHGPVDQVRPRGAHARLLRGNRHD